VLFEATLEPGARRESPEEIDSGMGRICVPYRLCLLGEHVDHQGGTTLSFALDRGIRFDFEAVQGPEVTVEAPSLGTRFVGRVDEPWPRRDDGSAYLGGMIRELQRQRGLTRGLRGEIRAEFPGGGVSSSAAVQIAYGAALLEVNDLTLDPHTFCDAVLNSERSFVGVQVGALDPMSILFAARDALLEIDHRTLALRLVRWPAKIPAPRWALVHSGVRRRLDASPYNARVRECAAAAESLEPGCRRLMDVAEDRRSGWTRLPEPLRSRARHVFTEAARVEAGRTAWEQGRNEELGRLIQACGESCVHDFDVGHEALTFLVGRLREIPGVLGARFTGAGFGGAVMALLSPDAEEEPIRALLGGDYARRWPDAAGRACVAFPNMGDGFTSPVLAPDAAL